MLLFVLVAGLVGGQAPATGLGAAFVAAGGVPLIIATLRLSSLWLRLVRLTAGGIAAVAGAVLSLQLGFMVSVANGKDPSGFSGALFLALVFAASGAWLADLRLAARDASDQLALRQLEADRHAELLARLGRRSAEDPAVRLRDLALLFLAARLLRR